MKVEKVSNGFVYLASPYTHPDPLVREWRFQKAAEAAARLMKYRP